MKEIATEQKYTSLDKKYKELFARTAAVVKEQRKVEKSKRDLERTVQFLRAELSMKGIFKSLEFQNGRVQMIGSNQPVDDPAVEGCSLKSKQLAGEMLEKVSTKVVYL